jgi:hypothetical protein
MSLNKFKESFNQAKKTIDWKAKYESREKAIRTLTEKNRALEQNLDLLGKRYQLIDKFLDTLSATYLQANWHKTKGFSGNRKILYEFDDLFKSKQGYSWIKKHLEECDKPMCLFEKKRAEGGT